MYFYLTQAIGALGYSILSISYYKKEKHKILFMQIIAYVLFAIHYYMLSGITGAVCNIIGLIALVGIYLSDKYKSNNKKSLIAFIIVLMLIITLYTAFINKEIFAIFPIIASVSVIISFLTNNEDTIRMIGVLAAVCWLIYARICGSYVAIVFEIITLLFTLIALVKNSKKRLEK